MKTPTLAELVTVTESITADFRPPELQTYNTGFFGHVEVSMPYGIRQIGSRSVVSSIASAQPELDGPTVFLA